MDPDRWRRIEEIYQSAAERKPAERDAFIVAACGEDEELRREVESLLAQQSVDTPLDHPACEVAGGLPSPQTLDRASDLAGLRVSHYEIQHKLGEGGMGVVYKARDIRLGRTVALKVLPVGKLADPDRKRRFVQEARAASALNHPNIVHVYDITSEGGTDYIVMEFVAGKTLDQMIPSKGMRLNEALKMASQMAGGLSAAHTAGIVHRDVKPGNVMVTGSGVVKLLDFGLAKLTEPETTGEMRTTQLGLRTEEGIIVGTASYMSPEQAQGEKVDTRSDIFSFGTVLYEMLTGRRLFARDSQAQSLAAILDSEPPPLPAEIPRELERVVARCLRKDVDHRFQHMDDVKIALDELKEDAKRRNLNSGRPAPSPSVWDKPVVRVGPEVQQSADGALSQRPRLGSGRRCDRRQSLMRHRCLAAALTVAPLPSAMRLLSSLAGLIALARCPDLVAPPPTSTQITAIALAAIACGADRKHPAAAWLAALARPEAFEMTVRRPHLTNVHQFDDD